MGIFARYLISEILKTLFPIWLSLGFLLYILEWLAQVFRIQAPASIILLLYAYKMPSHLQLVFPIAVLLSILLVLGSMNRNREIVAAQSFGNSTFRLIVPCFAAVFIAGIANYWVMNSLAPWGMRHHYDMEDRYVNRVPSRFSQIRQDKIWYRNRDILYNVGHFATAKDELYDVTIYTFDESFQIAQIIRAAMATWNGKNWTLTNGTIALTDKRLQTPISEPFKTRTTRLIEDPKSLKRIEFNPETMGEWELLRAINRHHALGINTARWEVVFHSRLSFFLISVVFLLLALPLSLKYRRSGTVGRDTVFVATLCLSYWLAYNFSVNLGNMGKVNPVVASWTPSLIFLFGAIIYINTLKLKSLSE